MAEAESITLAETWRQVPVAPQYEVSDHGRVRRPEAPDSIGRPRRARTLRPCNDGHGYLTVSLCVGGKSRSASVHGIVAEAFLGPRPIDYVVNHLNGDKQDNRPANLEYCTTLANVRHAHATGLAAVGERHGMAKLDAEAVRELRERAATGMTTTELAAAYGVHRDQALKIVRGRIWRSVGGPRSTKEPVAHCKRGHAFTETNTGHFQNGARFCKACKAAYDRRRSRRNGRRAVAL